MTTNERDQIRDCFRATGLRMLDAIGRYSTIALILIGCGYLYFLRTNERPEGATADPRLEAILRR